MRKAILPGYVIIIFALFFMATHTTACARSIITLKVVDAETRQPIKEAIVAYRWYKVKMGVPGLPTEDITIDAGEDISDLDGAVKMPKYSMLLNCLTMVVYKKGYVCWSNLEIFPGWKERKNFKLNDGMVIQMDEFEEVYSAKDHAWFTSCMSTGLPQGPRLGEALTKEHRLLLNRSERDQEISVPQKAPGMVSPPNSQGELVDPGTIPRPPSGSIGQPGISPRLREGQPE
jgi:hypothetical protein